MELVGDRDLFDFTYSKDKVEHLLSEVLTENENDLDKYLSFSIPKNEENALEPGRKIFFDKFVEEFNTQNPNNVVVNLTFGDDGRFWRVNRERCRYFDVVDNSLLGLTDDTQDAKLYHRLFTKSILDERWMDEIASISNFNVLIIVEELFHYLNRGEIEALFQKLERKFLHSHLIAEISSSSRKTYKWHSTNPYKKKGLNEKLTDPLQIELFGSGVKLAHSFDVNSGTIIFSAINNYYR